jgi:ppGpp synthetase/RelA/SpoT-type nucleotidyltranferase
MFLAQLKAALGQRSVTVPHKPSIDEYRSQAIAELGFPDATAARQAFDFNIVAARQTLEQSAVFDAIISELEQARAGYSPGRNELLFFSDIRTVRFDTKSFESVLNKLYRHNVLYNRRFPAPHRDGNIRPDELYEKINDLLRTRIICKYMDGPRYVCECLSKRCTGMGIDNSYKELSTDAGYYAFHFYFKLPVEINIADHFAIRNIPVEIQFFTQLSEVIAILTHGLYEERRLEPQLSLNKEWKWDPSSTAFRSAYLGHGLHLLEGIIQALKDDLSRPGVEPLALVKTHLPEHPDITSSPPTD